ncbi:MAG: membrane-bound lytic murein transglycosylase MltF [Methylococcales bacterium]|nr:membrane-bound lytic murein transglycosylase MltF [Methylococcales bacterium]
MKRLRILIIPVIMQFSGATSGIKWQSTLEDIKKQGKLVVLTRESPATLYYENNQTKGFEYELTQQLADSLAVDVEYKLYDNPSELMTALANGDGHIAAPGLSVANTGHLGFQLGPGYKDVNLKVVCNKKFKLPDHDMHLAQHSLLVIANSAQEHKLQALKQQLPELTWDTADATPADVLQKIDQGDYQCTVIDSSLLKLHRPHYPNLVEAYTTDQAKLSWLLPQDADNLNAHLHTWLKRAKHQSTLSTLNERYFGFTDIYDYYDTVVFKQRIKKRLPKYLNHFRQVASDYQLPWALLASIAYQESQWNPHAISPTGVRGLMMLTKSTARELGIVNRTNPKLSIRGGAKYLKRMLKQTAPEIDPNDRMWFALAAYNAGAGHVRDARKLARKLGKNPNVWADVKEVFPLLSQRRYFTKLKHGYARGHEPVRYIDRIRLYHRILNHSLQAAAV